jgi:uncharacterized protein
MQLSRSIQAILWLTTVAVCGALLMWVPGQLLSQYRAVKELGTTWVYVYFTIFSLGALMCAGVAGYVMLYLWSNGRRKVLRQQQLGKNPSNLTVSQQSQEITENIASVQELQEHQHLAPEVKASLETLLGQLQEKRAQRKLEIVAFGTISSGKSSLLNALAGSDIFNTDLKGGTTIVRQEIPWTGLDRVWLIDTPGLAEIDGVAHVNIAANAAQNADLVLVVVDGPLRESEHRLLVKLADMEKCILLCLNKIDWYGEREQQQLLAQLREQTLRFTCAENVVAVRSQMSQRTRIRVSSHGHETEETVPVLPDISPLATRMLQIVKREGDAMLLANLLLQSRGLVTEAKAQAQAALKTQAHQVVDKYTWIAGSAAALAPTPVLDLIAGSAITSKMVIDLAAVYKHEIDLATVQELLTQLGKNLISILGVSAIAPAVVASVATLLKTVPGAGTIVGGLLQGIVQALVTRWIGTVFTTYFADASQQTPTALASLARREWQTLTSVAELHKFVMDARKHLSGK